MASDRLAAVLRSRGQLSEEEIENMSEEAAWQWLRTNASVQHQADVESLSADDT